jgi:hypothetical protein
MQGEDVAVGLGAFDLDGKSRVPAAAKRSVEAADQGIKLRRGKIFKASEVGDNPMADLPLLVAIALNQL